MKKKLVIIGSGSHGAGLGDNYSENTGSGSSGTGLGDNAPKSIEPVKQKLTVVFPYFKEMAQGKELLYAMRSIGLNLREDFKVVVIGDSEDWFSDEVIHIAADRVSENPQVDTLYKLMLAIGDERVSDGFIWANDDIYTVSPTLLADIQVLTAQGKLAYLPNSTKVYEVNRNKTVELLKKLGLKDHNYDTHTPFYFEKEKLVELFEKIDALNSEGLLLPSIYFNSYFGDHTPAQIDGVTGNYMLRIMSKNTNPADFQKYIVGKKFLNNAEAGYNSVLVSYLEKNFSEKSRFEK